MPSPPDHPHHVRRVVLPSGKTLEVVYFEDAAPTPRPSVEPPSLELHVCPSCDSGLVHPVDWEEAGPDRWEVLLRCPNCEWHTTAVHAQETMERFDEHLEAGTETLIDDLRRLTHANMEDETRRFVSALRAGYVVPEDF